MTARARRSRQPVNTWPGFVDALAALLMVVIFLLTVFVVSQFYLRETLSGRERALQRLGQQINELAELLSLERQASADLRLNIEQISVELQSSITQRDDLETRMGQLNSAVLQSEAMVADLENDLFRAKDRMASLEARLGEEEERIAETLSTLEDRERLLAEAESRYWDSESSLTEERSLSERQRSQIALLNRQIGALRKQLRSISLALEATEERDKENKIKIANLGKRLNVALAGKVQELARYRSEFFGRLRQVLGDRSDIRVVGDRFVFQSEVLFESASAELGPEGQAQLSRLAETLAEISYKIPDDINWILRIDGHTDENPISTYRYHSNWELSAARAISVVNFLIGRGVPPYRLTAAGFGEFYPLDKKKTEAAYRRNRRIEIKLTQR